MEPLIENHCQSLLENLDEDNVQLDSLSAPLSSDQVEQKYLLVLLSKSALAKFAVQVHWCICPTKQSGLEAHMLISLRVKCMPERATVAFHESGFSCVMK
jgi:hypothetical protein